MSAVDSQDSEEEGLDVSNLQPPPPPPTPPTRLKGAQSPSQFSPSASTSLLDDLMRLVQSTTDESIAKLVEYHVQEYELRKELVHNLRENFILENELNRMDEKIKLLIKNRITVQQVISESSGVLVDVSSPASQNPLKQARESFEHMFYLLQTHPEYLARLTPLVRHADNQTFIQFVVFTLFGDQFETREERLLLSYIRIMLKAELAACRDMGSFMRANTAFTHILSAYARRGAGPDVLKQILLAPIERVFAAPTVSLEIDVDKIKALLSGQLPSTVNEGEEDKAEESGPSSVIDESTMNQLRINIAALLTTCQDFLDSIVATANEVPYGLRWICKQIAEMAREQFVDADQTKIGSLIGGFLYLRFLNPAIVAPDGLNIVKAKPNKTVRRNLILVAKIIQNISNASYFKKDRPEYEAINRFIESNISLMSSYFETICDVEDVESILAVDKYLVHVQQRDMVIHISLKEIKLIYSLLDSHINTIAPEPGDALRAVLKSVPELGSLTAAQERECYDLKLVPLAKEKELIETDMTVDRAVQLKVYEFGQLLVATLRDAAPLYATLKQRNPAAVHFCLPELLSELRAEAERVGSVDLQAALDRCLVHSCCGKADMLQDIHEHLTWQLRQLAQLEKKRERLKNALSSVESHHMFLEDKLRYYKEFLDQARRPVKGADNKNTFQYSHAQLESLGVIQKSAVESRYRKGVQFEFSSPAAGVFTIKASFKGLGGTKFTLLFDDLLEKQSNNEKTIDLEGLLIDLNVLIHLLNTKFIMNLDGEVKSFFAKRRATTMSIKKLKKKDKLDK
eukprot:GILK01005888.1.p1 GENE.GILK01005888.1~~GILK01005888.1.p1  ORF type:complete len:816 (+),score=159.79 GILK01005888.1:49-2448(+)